MATPRIVLLPAVNRKPSLVAPAFAPLSSMSGVPVKPGWVVPSIITGWEMEGNALARVMVCTPVPGI
jgi:hypothetical protein